MADPNPQEVASALATHVPAVMRWCGSVARRLRGFDISLTGKSSGSAMTDALTLADLTVQEILVSALRDTDPIFRECGIEAEEESGDLLRFNDACALRISIDPIDGTKCYRDRTGVSYAIMLHLRDVTTLYYSLVFVPERTEHGTWVQAWGNHVVTGPDDPTRPAGTVITNLPKASRPMPSERPKIYVIGFQDRDPDVAGQLGELGLEGIVADGMPSSVYELMATGEFAGSLIHTPNIYDFPVSAHIARAFGGDAVWVHDRQPVRFDETWMDDRADMLRLPGITACSVDPTIRDRLCDLARDWSRDRYAD